MGRLVDLDDITDSAGAAEIVGLKHRNHISLYRERYSDFPAPVVNLGNGRCLLFLRSELEAWKRTRGRRDG